MTEDMHYETDIEAAAEALVPEREQVGTDAESIGEFEPGADAAPIAEAAARGSKGLVLALLGVAVVTAGFAASVWAARSAPQVTAAVEATDCNT